MGGKSIRVSSVLSTLDTGSRVLLRESSGQDNSVSISRLADCTLFSTGRTIQEGVRVKLGML